MAGSTKRSSSKKGFINKPRLQLCFSYSRLSLQSAMEYLMTYGWAILTIAIVLAALFSLGIFGGTTLSSQACIAQPGYLCSNPLLNTSGYLTVTFGEVGSTITITGLNCTSGTTPSSFVPAGNILLSSGQQMQLTFKCPLTGNTVGTPFAGSLYIQYNSGPYSGLVAKVATVTARAVSAGVLASSIPSTPSNSITVPSGIVAYTQLTITNSQSSATPAGFQQMVNITESNFANYITYNGNIANFEFFYGNGTIVPAWIESNQSGKLIVWLKIGPSIAASSSYNSIYLGFAAKTANLLSSSGTSGIGEAPTLSGTYGQYDNGMNVFYIYGNFQGSSIPSGWTVSAQEGSYTPALSNGGLEMMNNGGGQATALKWNSAFATQNVIVEASWMYSGSADDMGFGIYTSGPISGSMGGGWNPASSNGYYNSYEFWSGSKPAIISPAGTAIATAPSQDMPTSGTNYVFSQVIATTSSMAMNFVTITSGLYQYPVYSGLTNAVSYSGTISNSYSTFYVGSSTGGYTSYQYLYWIRVRAYPPSGVMPSVSFGSIT